MGKLGKPSLVQWSSTNAIKNDLPTKMIRKSTIMYFVALVTVIGLYKLDKNVDKVATTTLTGAPSLSGPLMASGFTPAGLELLNEKNIRSLN